MHLRAPDRSSVRRAALYRALALAVPAALWLVPASHAALPGSRDLNSGWRFRAVAAKDHPEMQQWHEAIVPGVVQTDLLRAGLISDPFYGDNEQRLQWIGESDWEYTTAFDMSTAQLRRKHIDLVFDGLDTFADVTLNGHPVLQADNMFRAWRVDGKALLRPGRNELHIIFHSPIKRMTPIVAALPYMLPGTGFEPMDPAHGVYPVSQYIRKSPYQFGWDWAPKLVTEGIWRAVRMESWDDVRITDLNIRQESVSQERARVSADVTVESDTTQTVDFELRVTGPAGETFLARRAEEILDPGENHVPVPLRIANPKLWYPNGYGAQSRYQFSVAVHGHGAVLANAQVKTGLRSVELRRVPDQWGKSFAFVVNGIPIFAQGADLVPFDSFPSRVTLAQQRRILEAARDSNFNMVRLWGGGYYESEEFYELCDQLGLMVWQEFIFGGAMVPGDVAFQQNVAAEAEQQLVRLRNHPAIVLWCGNNEVETGWTYWGDRKRFAASLTPEQRQKVWQDYIVMFHDILKSAVERSGNGVPYWPSSPSANLEENSNSDDNGDVHYWNVWSGKAEPIEEYLHQTPRFMSEFGFQSLPDLRTVRAFAGSDEDLASAVLMDHERYVRGYDHMKTYLGEYFAPPKDFASFVYLSQVLQAEAVKIAAEHLRSEMPRTMGSLYWQLNDCWPVASWSSIDYFGRWKALQFYARRFYAPVLVAPEYADGKITTHVVSNRQSAFKAEMQLRLMDMQGKILLQRSLQVTVAPLDSTPGINVSTADLKGLDPATTFAVIDLTADGRPVARNTLYFARPLKMQLPPAHLQAEAVHDGSGYAVRVSSDTLARDVFLSFGDLGVQPKDNYFDLLPGESVLVSIDGNTSLQQLRASMHVMSLADATVSTPQH